MGHSCLCGGLSHGEEARYLPSSETSELGRWGEGGQPHCLWMRFPLPPNPGPQGEGERRRRRGRRGRRGRGRKGSSSPQGVTLCPVPTPPLSGPLRAPVRDDRCLPGPRAHQNHWGVGGKGLRPPAPHPPPWRHETKGKAGVGSEPKLRSLQNKIKQNEMLAAAAAVGVATVFSAPFSGESPAPAARRGPEEGG